MRRRRLLSAAGLALGTAGCLAIGDDTSGATTPGATSANERAGTTSQRTTSKSREATTLRATVNVTEVTLQQTLVFLETDYLSTTGGDGRYLLADVAVSEGRVDPSTFGLRVDGDVYPADDGRRVGRLWRVYQAEHAFEPDVCGLLLFELPASGFDATANAAVTWPGDDHRLRAGLRERLRADAPALSVSVDGPETVLDSESPTFTVAVTNDGAVPARLVAGLNRFGPRVASIPVKRFSLLADAAETTTTTYTDDTVTGGRIDDAAIGDGHSDVRYAWNGATRDLDFSVRYVHDDG
jgi:hypothetical protein